MLLRGIAAGAARVSRAPPSALPTVVNDNAIPGNSGQATRQDVIKSRTSPAIGIIFLAATLAALSRSGAARGDNRTYRNAPVQSESKSLEHGSSIDLRGGRRRRRDRSVRSRSDRPVHGR